jgi:lipopolysaccharide export system protein LptC
MPLRLNFKGSSTGDDPHQGLGRLIREETSITPETLAQTRRNTFLVRALRLALPIIAISLVVVMFAWSDQEKIAPPPPRTEIAPEIQGRNELINPRFESKDSDLQPYTITADKAYQREDDLNVVMLHNPAADINLKDGAWLAVKADAGEFDQVNQMLKLFGNVKMFHDDGYELTMPSLAINITAQEAMSLDPIQGHGPIGTIKAQGLIADGAKGTLVFTGKSQLILHEGGSRP